MLISVLVSTYNQPEWIEKVLWGLAVKTDRAFEVVIADDGSGPETRAAIERAAVTFPVPVRHVWQEDRGFGKCAILNQAILDARGEYLVMLDGDCVPRRDFLAVHRSLARPGRFLSGGACRLPLDVCRRITREDVESGRAHDPRWLRSAGVPASIPLLRLGAGPRLAWLLDLLTTTRASFNGNNSSVWRHDAVRINGFDECMEYGGLDREFGERLENAGVRGLQIRHRAVLVHLDHPREYKRPEALARNLAIRSETRTTGRVRAEMGLDRHGRGGTRGLP